MLLVPALVTVGMCVVSVAMKRCFSFNPMFQHSLSQVLYREHRAYQLGLENLLRTLLERCDDSTNRC